MLLYFTDQQVPQAGNGDFSTTFSGMWRNSGQAVKRLLSPIKTKDAITTGTTVTGQAAAFTNTLDRQYVTPGLLGPQLITGQISGQLMVREYATQDNMDRVILCGKVVSNNGKIIRGFILNSGNYGPTLEFISNATHRNKTIASGQNLTAITGQDGDRLVFEIGYTASAGGTTPDASARWGANAPLLPVNETQTTDGAGWIAITSNLKFRETEVVSIDSADGLYN